MKLIDKVQEEAKDFRTVANLARYIGVAFVAATAITGLITIDKVADAHAEHTATSYEEQHDFETRNDPSFPAAFTVLFATAGACALSLANLESSRAAALEAQAFVLKNQQA